MKPGRIALYVIAPIVFSNAVCDTRVAERACPKTKP